MDEVCADTSTLRMTWLHLNISMRSQAHKKVQVKNIHTRMAVIEHELSVDHGLRVDVRHVGHETWADS